MRIRLESLQLQLLGLIVLPFSLVLLGIALLGINVHESAMRQLVAERDERAVRAAAAAISERLHYREAAVKCLSLRLDDGVSPEKVIAEAQYLFNDFDGGLAAVNKDGQILASSTPTVDWGARQLTELLEALVNDQAGYSKPYWESGVRFVLIGFRTGDQVVVGSFSIDNLVDAAFPGGSMIAENQSTLLIDETGDVLYQSGDILSDDDLREHAGIQAAMRGEIGSSYFPTRDGEHVVAFSPIQLTNWALIIEEPWEKITSPLLDISLGAPLILVPALLTTSIALWFGARKIIRPLRKLEEEASKFADPNYKAIEEPVGGIAEIERLQQTLILMTRRIHVARESLQAYIGAITDAQEDERKRLARELHDETVQDLIAIGQRIQMVGMDLSPRDLSAANQLDDIRSDVLRSISEIRRLIRALRPIYLDDLGLIPAFEMLTNDFQEDFGVLAEFEVQGRTVRLDPDVELAVYRIAQESLSNIGRHANAQSVSMQLTFDEESISIEISDDGEGFNPPERHTDLAASGHYGLLGMYERAEVIRASLEIRSASGHGTDVIVALPFTDQNQNNDPV